ncbi:unnamed protein product [Effrenium voratum]|nr:unnamed protein product [Effrenium voratum]
MREVLESDWRAVVVSLDARIDRRKRTCALLAPHRNIWANLSYWPALNGQELGSERLVPQWLGNTHSSEPALPRFERLRGSEIWWNHDWLHLTPGSVGCALSHRAVWETLARSGEEWWLVLEDDLLWVASDLERCLEQVLSQLPDGWHLCYLGWHGPGVAQLALGDEGILEVKHPRLEELRLPRPAELRPLGTFAYLLSRAGAARLLQPGAVFPLQRQLDAQLLELRGQLRAFRCLEGSCLFYSAPCQLLDSDVQACWSADHDLGLREMKRGLLRRKEALDKLAQTTASGCAERAKVCAPETSEAAASARLAAPRLCCACVVVEGVGSVEAATRLVRAATSVVPHTAVLLVWYGEEPGACMAALAACGLAPGCALFRGPLEEALEAACPGSGCLSSAAAANFLALPALLGLCTEDLLVIGEGSELWAHVSNTRRSAVLARAAHRTFLEDSLDSAFQELRGNPEASYVGLEDTRLAPAFDPQTLLYRSRAWARLATWVREMLRISLRLMAGGLPAEVCVAAAARCIVGLSGLELELLPAHWERCD